MLSIFNYVDVATYLRDVFEEKRKANPLFSLRSWAKQLGMKSHGPFHAMLKGERSIPKKYVPKLLSGLQLSAKEKKYFETLVDYSRAKNIEEKEFYHAQLRNLSPKELREVAPVTSMVWWPQKNSSPCPLRTISKTSKRRKCETMR